jgi:hypothetical protein
MASTRCPICDRPFERDTSPAVPFCSHRCRRIDLNRWLEEGYGLPYESESEPPGVDADDMGRTADDA